MLKLLRQAASAIETTLHFFDRHIFLVRRNRPCAAQWIKHTPRSSTRLLSWRPSSHRKWRVPGRIMCFAEDGRCRHRPMVSSRILL